jgi:hypothetical protein
MNYLIGYYEEGRIDNGYQCFNFKSISGEEHPELIKTVIHVYGRHDLDEQLQEHCKAVLAALNARQTPSALMQGLQQMAIDSLTEDNQLLLKFVATLLEYDATHAEIFKLAHRMGVMELIGDADE